MRADSSAVPQFHRLTFASCAYLAALTLEMCSTLCQCSLQHCEGMYTVWDNDVLTAEDMMKCCHLYCNEVLARHSCAVGACVCACVCVNSSYVELTDCSDECVAICRLGPCLMFCSLARWMQQLERCKEVFMSYSHASTHAHKHTLTHQGLGSKIIESQKTWKNALHQSNTSAWLSKCRKSKYLQHVYFMYSLLNITKTIQYMSQRVWSLKFRILFVLLWFSFVIFRWFSSSVQLSRLEYKSQD